MEKHSKFFFTQIVKGLHYKHKIYIAYSYEGVRLGLNIQKFIKFEFWVQQFLRKKIVKVFPCCFLASMSEPILISNDSFTFECQQYRLIITH